MNRNQEYSILHPVPYIEKQIVPPLKANDLTKEVVWTYLVARKYENSHPELAKKLCGVGEQLPENSKIWLEAYLHPTRIRQEEKKCWRSRADLSIGFLKFANDREAQIEANGEWVCIVESKWYEDIHPNSRFRNIFQFSQLIEHALLLHDMTGNFPERVYVTLLTPRYFKDRKGQFSERSYWQKYHDYTTDRATLEKDLKLCPLRFLEHDENTLLSRIEALKLWWVTFEDLLGLPELVSPHIPGKYRTNYSSWEEVFWKMGAVDLYTELIGGKQ